MSNPRPDKVAVVKEVQAKFADADAAIVTEYRGMTVAALATLRRELRGVGAEYKVYKNTMARFGARGAGKSNIEEFLVGPTAITFVKGDVAAAAKVLKEQSKTNPLLVVKVVFSVKSQSRLRSSKHSLISRRAKFFSHSSQAHCRHRWSRPPDCCRHCHATSRTACRH